MDLYLYSRRLDLAATSLADLNALIAALADESDPDNAATLARVTGKLDALVQADTGEPLNIYSYDDASGTVSSWITDAGTTLAIGLGNPDPATADTYASTSSTSIVGSHRTATLALNTQALADALALRLGCGRRTVADFTLHLRKTTAGVTKSVALLSVQVAAGVLSAALTTAAVNPAFSAGAVTPVPDITSLTGGGTTALDGIVTANGAVVTGSVVLLSYGRVGQLWQLIAGTDAENTAAGVVRPDDYNASTNARIWVQL